MKYFLLIIILFGMLHADITINSPNAWSSVRANPLSIQLVADSISIGKTVQFTVSLINQTKTVSLKTINLKVTDANISFDVTLPENMLGGEGYYAISWKNDSGQVVSLAPLGYAPIQLKPDPLSATAGTIANPKSFLASNGIAVGDARVAFGWTHDKLLIVVKGEAQIGLDPANLKSAFLAFSHRYITTKVDAIRPFYYYSRSAMKEKVDYKAMLWSGTMSISQKEVTVIEVPWYELGVKSFNSRIIGVFISSGEESFPSKANKKMPSSWGELLLK